VQKKAAAPAQKKRAAKKKTAAKRKSSVVVSDDNELELTAEQHKIIKTLSNDVDFLLCGDIEEICVVALRDGNWSSAFLDLPEAILTKEDDSTIKLTKMDGTSELFDMDVASPEIYQRITNGSIRLPRDELDDGDEPFAVNPAPLGVAHDNDTNEDADDNIVPPVGSAALSSAAGAKGPTRQKRRPRAEPKTNIQFVLNEPTTWLGRFLDEREELIRNSKVEFNCLMLTKGIKPPGIRVVATDKLPLEQTAEEYEIGTAFYDARTDEILVKYDDAVNSRDERFSTDDTDDAKYIGGQIDMGYILAVPSQILSAVAPDNSPATRRKTTNTKQRRTRK